MGAALQVTEERSPGLAGDVAVAEEYLLVLGENPASATKEELRRFEEAVNHLVREQREVLQDGT